MAGGSRERVGSASAAIFAIRAPVTPRTANPAALEHKPEFADLSTSKIDNPTAVAPTR
ncbi:hypothetical protein JCM33774_13510 [Actinophytocola sp. KF-1]